MSSAFILMHAYHSMQHKIVAHCQSVHLLENQLLTCLYQSQNIRLYHYYTVLCWQYKRNKNLQRPPWYNVCRLPFLISTSWANLYQKSLCSSSWIYVELPNSYGKLSWHWCQWLKKRLLHYLAISFTSPLPHVWQDEIGLKTSLGHLRYFTLVYNSFLPH